MRIGDLVEIDGRLYDVVSDKAGRVALEPAITKTVEELRAKHRGRPLTQQEFDELFGERHPDLVATRSVYERAHKRLHSRHPDQ